MTLEEVTGGRVWHEVVNENRTSGSARSSALRRSAAAVEMVTAGIFGVAAS